MKNTHPFFSIIIPAYNAEKTIALTLKSVYQQTFTNYEIIVVNDGSKDRTAEILEKHCDPRLRIIHQSNGGECHSRNRAIKEAKGEYLAFLDSDDAWTKNHLFLAWIFFKSFPEIEWYCSDHCPMKEINEEDIDKQCDYSGFFTCVNMFLRKPVLPSTAVIKKTLVKKENLFPNGVKMHGDNMAFCKIAKDSPIIGCVDVKTTLYRIWEGSITNVYIADQFSKMGWALPALMQHAEMCASKMCSNEAKLFFKWFSLNNWWLRIRKMSIRNWSEEIRNRELTTGKLITKWLLLFSYMSDIYYRIMGKLVRMSLMRVQKRMQREKKRQTKVLGEVESLFHKFYTEIE